MLRIDQQITNTSNIICRNIKSIPNESRGAASQDILAQIRNLIEAIMVVYDTLKIVREFP